MISKNKIKAAFLDRDGVINFDKGYLSKFSDIKFRVGVFKGLRLLNKKKFKIFIITNQAGVAKGVIKIEDLKILNQKLIKFLKKKNIIISKIEYCPHHKNGVVKRFTKICKCRKPNNLMIRKVLKKWKVKKNKSFMIGDRLTDKLCAKKSKIYFEYAKPNFFFQIKSILKNI